MLIDLKQFKRSDNDMYLVYDIINDKLWVIKNFSCPARVYEHLSKNYYGYDIDSYKYYKNFQTYWYDSNKPLEQQVYKKYYKRIKQLLDLEEQ